MDTLVGQSGSQAVNGFDFRWTLTLRRVQNIVGMGHLALAIEIFDPSRDDSRRTDRELPLQPTPVGAKESQRQEPRSVKHLDAMGSLVRMRRLIGMHLALDRRHFAEFDLIEARPNTAINPSFRQVQQQVPERVAVDQPFEQRLQLRPDACQRVQSGKHWKKSFIPHGATLSART